MVADKLRVKVDIKDHRNPAPCPMAMVNQVMKTVKWVKVAKEKAEKVKEKANPMARAKAKVKERVKAKVKTVMLTKKGKRVPKGFPINSKRK